MINKREIKEVFKMLNKCKYEDLEPFRKWFSNKYIDTSKLENRIEGEEWILFQEICRIIFKYCFLFGGEGPLYVHIQTSLFCRVDYIGNSSPSSVIDLLDKEEVDTDEFYNKLLDKLCKLKS